MGIRQSTFTLFSSSRSLLRMNLYFVLCLKDKLSMQKYNSLQFFRAWHDLGSSVPMASGAMKSGDVNTVVQQLSTLATLHSGRGGQQCPPFRAPACCPTPHIQSRILASTGPALLYSHAPGASSIWPIPIRMSTGPDSLPRFLGYQWENFFGLTEIYAYLVHPVGLNITSETSILCGSTLHWTFSCSRSPLLISAPRLDDLCIQLVDCIGW
jgi:hypothetical protein